MQKTYLVETTHALFTFSITKRQDGGLYSASYIGTLRRIAHFKANNPDWAKENFEGAAEGDDFNALVAMCHEKMAKCGGGITSVEDISGDIQL